MFIQLNAKIINAIGCCLTAKMYPFVTKAIDGYRFVNRR
jgi:hypothetical protein